MRSQKPPQSSLTPKTRVPSGSGSILRSGWPLLLYPALALAALVVLYVANRPHSRSQPRVGGPAARTTASAVNPLPAGGVAHERTPASAVDPNSGTGTSVLPSGARGQPPRRPTSGADAPASAETGPAVNEPPLLAALRQALQNNDQIALKKCMDQLVTLGDQAIPWLCDAVARGGDAGAIWAAEALARIGTPAATQSLLDTLGQVSDGTYKEQLVKKLSNIGNHDSWPILLDAVQTSQDAGVRRAASTSLAQMADAPVVDELVARYDSAGTIDEAAEWANTVAHISSAKASEALLALARQVPSVSEDPLDQAVLSALANVGDAQCVNYLLSRLEASQPGESAYLMNLVGQINQPRAQASLIYAAAGSKDVSAELGRTAAIQALANYPDEQTYVLLEQIASVERNAVAATAAARALTNIQRTAPMLAANAQFRLDEHILVTAPVKK